MIKRRLAHVRDQSGFALVLGVALMTLLAVFAVVLITSVTSDNTRSRSFPPRDGAYQAAEAGINAYTAKLLENPLYYDQFVIAGEATRTGYSSSATADLTYGGPTSWTYASKNVWCDPSVCRLNGYQYDIQVCPPMQSCAGIGTNQIPYLRIVSTGRPVGNTDKRTWRAIELDVRPFSLTHFQMFTAGDYSVGTGGNTYGPIYAQGNISHAGTAYADVMAEGTVSGLSSGDLQGTPKAKIYWRSTPSASDYIRKAPGLATKPNFNDFLVSQTDTKSAAQAGGVYLNDPTQDAFNLVFQPDGTMLVSKCKKAVVSGVTKPLGDTAPVCGAATSYTLPNNGAVYVEQSALVSGVMHGRVTIVSAQDLIVRDNLTYAQNGSDILGLIGNHDVLVPNYAPQTLEWHSAVIAQTGARKAYTNNGDHNTLNFYGSVTSYGSPSMTMFRTRNYNPDPTLSYLSPPWFPVLNDQLQVLVEREVTP